VVAESLYTMSGGAPIRQEFSKKVTFEDNSLDIDGAKNAFFGSFGRDDRNSKRMGRMRCGLWFRELEQCELRGVNVLALPQP
jgi:hypothetical protein